MGERREYGGTVYLDTKDAFLTPNEKQKLLWLLDKARRAFVEAGEIPDGEYEVLWPSFVLDGGLQADGETYRHYVGWRQAVLNTEEATNG